VVTDADGHFTLRAKPGAPITISYIGYASADVNATPGITVTLKPSENVLNEVVVTALGIQKDKKSLGYAIDDMKSEELMLNKTSNALSSLSGKISGVTVTQGSGAAGSGAQIVLRGSTSLERDNQPLFVVDGMIYDNSTSVVGNTSYDGMSTTNTTNSNRVMDINPEDIDNISVLKGPAAAALYGSRAAQGVIIITTKKGKAGNVKVNLNSTYTTSWATNLPERQTTYKRGYYYSDSEGNPVLFTDNSMLSWGEKYGEGESAYNNVDNFFQNGGIWDTNLSVSGGNENGNFFLSGSYYDQDGIIPTTGYTKSTFRFNGEQKWRMFTFSANAAYSQARTNKTLTSAGLYDANKNSYQGTGSMSALYTFPDSEDMSHYLNADGSKYRMFADYQELESDVENPYWLINNYSLKDNTSRFTGNFNIKADITPWWWISYRMGVDEYTTNNSVITPVGAAVPALYQNGRMSQNSLNYRYLNTNLMTNFSQKFGDFDFNLMLGTSTDYTKSNSTYLYGWDFVTPGFYSLNNINNSNKYFITDLTRRRLVGAFGEFRADWKSTAFVTVTGRNDWSSTLPKENRSYFYPSVSGSLIFTNLLQDANIIDNDVFTFGKIRASWARVGKDATAYATNTYLNTIATVIGGGTGVGTSWSRGNSELKPETTESTEIGLELRFFKNRFKLDYAYYTNNTYDQIIAPRGAQSTGYIFCLQNCGNVYNKGMELTIGGTPIQTKDWEWETSLNVYGNRGKVKNLPDGTSIIYVTDVQYGGAKAASFDNGAFLGISGTRWRRNDAGQLVLDKNGMPQQSLDENGAAESNVCVGNREPKFQGGWNNNVRYKNFSFNMLWEFRVGGDVFNATEYSMINQGVSKYSENRESLHLEGVNDAGEPVSYDFNTNGTYTYNGKQVSGAEIIRTYYTSYRTIESRNFITKVNSLRLRTISLSYSLPKNLLAKTKAFTSATVTAAAHNLLLFTNYHGDPEVCAAGSGVGGSGSYGFDYYTVPNTASFSFGINLGF
jgi:TonB-linked SusC/RagA family outer membrane protein